MPKRRKQVMREPDMAAFRLSLVPEIRIQSKSTLILDFNHLFGDLFGEQSVMIHLYF